jgi:hypothetical protein
MIYFFNGLELRKIKSFKQEFNLSWEQINHLRIIYFSKEGKAFFKMYGIKPTIFNVSVYEKLKGVFVYETEANRFKELKGGIKE